MQEQSRAKNANTTVRSHAPDDHPTQLTARLTAQSSILPPIRGIVVARPLPEQHTCRENGFMLRLVGRESGLWPELATWPRRFRRLTHSARLASGERCRALAIVPRRNGRWRHSGAARADSNRPPGWQSARTARTKDLRTSRVLSGKCARVVREVQALQPVLEVIELPCESRSEVRVMFMRKIETHRRPHHPAAKAVRYGN